KALQLDPSLAAAHFALGIYYYHGFLDYDHALAELSGAEKNRPNDFETVFFKAAIERRQGKWKEATANMQRAIALEPRIGTDVSDVANTYFFIRDYDEALRLSDRGMVLDPTDAQAYGIKGSIAIARSGDVNEAIRLKRQQFDAQPDAGIAAYN